MNINQEHRVITDEVEFWLDLSSTFFKFFKIKKDSGPCWFLLNEVLRDTEKPLTVSGAVEALTGTGVLRSKPSYDVSQYARYLCSVGLLDSSVLDLDQRRVLPANMVLRAGPKMQKAVENYVHWLVEELFDRETADRALQRSSGQAIMTIIYDFMRESYVPVWERFLNGLARTAAEKTRGRQSTIFGQLRADSEVFVLLHRMWEAHLSDEIGDGFALSDLKDLHVRTRVASSTALENCVEHLIKTKILDESEPGLFKLHADNFPLFEAYVQNFLEERGLLKDHLKPHIFAETLPECS
jgi:hypothetical protein